MEYKSLESIIRGIAEASIMSNPRAINVGHVKSGRSSYSSSAERDHAGGHASAMRRVADQERETKKEQKRSKDEMERQMDQRTKEAEKRREDLQKRIGEEIDPDRNTEQRKLVKVVSRPDDAKPTDSKSKLARTAAYKTNVIDEEKPMFNSDKNFGLSKSLIDAARSVVEATKADTSDVDAKKLSGKKTQVDLEPETKDKLPNADLDSGTSKKKDVKEAVDQLGEADVSTSKKVTGTAMHLGKDMKYDTNPKAFDAKTFDPKNKKTMPRNVYVKTKPSGKLPEEAEQPVDESLSPKQKKIAAMGGDKGKIDAADFKALRSGKCHECGKKPCECMKEETEIEEDIMKNIKSGIKSFKRGMSGWSGKTDPAGRPALPKDIVARVKGYGDDELKKYANWPEKGSRGSPAGLQIKASQHELKRRESSKKNEETDLSAEELEKLQAIAELFDEGKKKEKSVPSQTTIGSAPIRGANQDQSGFNTSDNVADYTISDETIHEARGRPRKNPLPAGQEKPEEEHEHPIVQLKKILIANGKVPFVHKNGEKSNMNAAMAQHGINLHNKMKTASEKEKFMNQIHGSHAGLKSALS